MTFFTAPDAQANDAGISIEDVSGAGLDRLGQQGQVLVVGSGP